MTIKRWLVEKLFPDVVRDAERYHYLWCQVHTVHRWCNGEAADVAQYLMDQDADHWRKLDAPPGVRNTPWEIQKFREWLYSRRTVQT